MPRLATALGPLLLAAARGSLAEAAARLGLVDSRVPAFPGAVAGIVLASAGYPASPRRGDVIAGLEDAAAQALVFHAGTTVDPDGTTRTSGGRVLAVVAHGPDLEAAAERADDAANRISFAGVQRRHDIGRTVPLAVTAGAAR